MRGRQVESRNYQRTGFSGILNVEFGKGLQILSEIVVISTSDHYNLENGSDGFFFLKNMDSTCGRMRRPMLRLNSVTYNLCTRAQSTNNIAFQ